MRLDVHPIFGKDFRFDSSSSNWVFFLELMNVIATGPRGGLLGPLGSFVGDATTKLDLLLGPGRVVLVRLFLRVLPKKHFAEKTQLLIMSM